MLGGEGEEAETTLITEDPITTDIHWTRYICGMCEGSGEKEQTNLAVRTLNQSSVERA